MVRGEADACEYEIGVEPPAQQPLVIPLSEYMSIKAKLDRVELALQKPLETTHPDSLCQQDRHRAAGQEKVFSAVECLAATSTYDSVGKAVNFESVGTCVSSNGSELFPNIIVSSTVRRSAKWRRDMSQIFEAMPNKAQMDFMLHFYFSEVQVLRRHILRFCNHDPDERRALPT